MYSYDLIESKTLQVVKITVGQCIPYMYMYMDGKKMFRLLIASLMPNYLRVCKLFLVVLCPFKVLLGHSVCKQNVSHLRFTQKRAPAGI
jgi:hypothetical protein